MASKAKGPRGEMTRRGRGGGLVHPALIALIASARFGASLPSTVLGQVLGADWLELCASRKMIDVKQTALWPVNE